MTCFMCHKEKMLEILIKDTDRGLCSIPCFDLYLAWEEIDEPKMDAHKFWQNYELVDKARGIVRRSV